MRRWYEEAGAADPTRDGSAATWSDWLPAGRIGAKRGPSAVVRNPEHDSVARTAQMPRRDAGGHARRLYSRRLAAQRASSV